MLSLWRRLPLTIRVLVVVLLALAAALVLFGCASEGTTAKHTAIEAGAAAAGALVAGPIGAGVGGGVAHLFNRASAGDEAASDAVAHAGIAITSLGPLARLGDKLDHLLKWLIIGGVAALFVFPRTRRNIIGFVTALLDKNLRRAAVHIGALTPFVGSPTEALPKTQREAITRSPKEKDHDR